ncbi:MAG: tRNA uridine-5-carboxymethylaminomethyl(34) synthesis GTPase MnmE [Clostridia bacterium]|nr:tRNA uridine-5-carboxymethylaminomethyl(34) synthesis GTPase MnmE [Clostridia bacterium]
MRQGVICAISTPPGKGGVAVIRMCGEGAFEIIGETFRPLSGRAITDYPPRTQIYGYIVDGNERIDDALVSLFPAPNSYTGEQTVEISCHGGALVTRTVLECLLTHGAIAAEAGEFTRRAFINGKLSLTEAEAIGDLLEAKSREQLRLASRPSRERLAQRIEQIRAGLTELMGSIYARIDYPDEDLGDFTDGESLERLEEILADLTRLIDTYRTGRVITEGISTVICGKPNVGKSSIYNLLLGEDSAIVTDIAGTTRDLLEKSVPLGRVMLNLIDTAGIRQGEGLDRVEQIGISRSRERLADADLILAVFDLSRPLDEEDGELIRLLDSIPATKICLLNKADRAVWEEADISSSFEYVLTISAERDGEKAISMLEGLIDRLFTDEEISCGRDAIVSSARQHSALCSARGYVLTAIEAYKSGLPVDLASSDIELALGAIGEVDGREVSESVVADIFSRFCVGK